MGAAMINERPSFGRFYEMDLLQTSYNVRFTILKYRNICIPILISTTRDSRYSYVYTRLPETSRSRTKSFHISHIRNRYLPLVTRKDDKEEDEGKVRKEEKKVENRRKDRKANYTETYYVCISEMLGAQQGARAF